MSKIQKAGKWVPHKLSENFILQCFNICVSLVIKRQRKDFLWKIVIGAKKRIY
jgi:hypothetical protein